jgi:hypothetical protein
MRPDNGKQRGVEGLNPNEIMHQFSAEAGEAIDYVADVGQHQR